MAGYHTKSFGSSPLDPHYNLQENGCNYVLFPLWLIQSLHIGDSLRNILDYLLRDNLKYFLTAEIYPQVTVPVSVS